MYRVKYRKWLLKVAISTGGLRPYSCYELSMAEKETDGGKEGFVVESENIGPALDFSRFHVRMFAVKKRRSRNRHYSLQTKAVLVYTQEVIGIVKRKLRKNCFLLRKKFLARIFPVRYSS